MGLILPQTVKVKIASLNYKYYREKRYEFEKCGDIIEVNVLDLHPGSTVKVKVVCDICGKEREMWYRTVVKCNKENKLITCTSKSCTNKKREDTCIKNYGEGITNPFQAESVKEKSKQTLLKNYGVENPMQNEEIKNKVLSSLQFNSTGPSSRAQRYINHILNGTLNKSSF